MIGTFPACTLTSGAGNESMADDDLFYTPLNGKSMQALAADKIHHGTTRFHNPFGSLKHMGFGRLLKWKLSPRNDFRRYYADEPEIEVMVDWQKVRDHRGLSVTFINHSSVLIKDEDRYFLVDPVFDGLMWFIHDFSPLAFDPRDMPAPDCILVTHGHYDHLDVDSLALFDKNTQVVTPLGYDDIFQDLKMTNRKKLDWFETCRVDGREITLIPCNHWTMRNPVIGPNTALWGSFVFKAKSGTTIYISGDTAYFDGFREIGSLYDIDLAIFNLGAYEPRWFMGPSHINPPETVTAFQEMNAERLMAIHWGTFRLGDEPVHFPPIDIRASMGAAGLGDRLVDIRHGKTVFL
jgi:N-acyl-phosphatidylethanolamine-hydrolysing phospholipase D